MSSSDNNNGKAPRTSMEADEGPVQPPAGAEGLPPDSSDPISVSAAAKVLLRAARKVLRRLRSQPKALPAIDIRAVSIDAREAYILTRDAEYAERAARDARDRWQMNLPGFPTARALAEKLKLCQAQLSAMARDTQREIERGPLTLVTRGEKAPWTVFHRAQVPVLLLISGLCFYLGWFAVKFLVSNSGILPAEQSWIVCSGAILATVGLELVVLVLKTHGQKHAYMKGLLVVGIVAWAIWVFASSYTYGKPLFVPPQLGAEAPDDVAVNVGWMQQALQLFGEILISAGCLIGVQLICEEHAGLRSSVHPDCRRRQRRLARILKWVAHVDVELARLNGKLAQLNAAAAAVETAARRVYETRLRQLRTEVSDLFPPKNEAPMEGASGEMPVIST